MHERGRFEPEPELRQQAIMSVVLAGGALAALQVFAAGLILLIGLRLVVPPSPVFWSWSAIAGLVGLLIAPLLAWAAWPEDRRRRGGFSRPGGRLAVGILGGAATAFLVLLIADLAGVHQPLPV